MNLNLIAPINNRSYGLVGINVLVELQKAGVDVALFPIPAVDRIEAEPQYHENIRQAIDKSYLPDFKATSLRLWHEHDMSLSVGYGPKVGWPIFERNKLTDQHKLHLRSLQKIIVCSKWAKDVVTKELNGLKDIDFDLSLAWEDFVHVVPLGVNRDIFNEHVLLPKYMPLDSPLGVLWEASRDKVIFWHQGKQEIRKGHGFLHESLKKALGDKKDWELWVSWANPFVIEEENDKWENLYKETLGDHVRFIPWVQSQVEMAQIMSLTDYALFPSLSEGWCLPCLEALSMGKGVVATNYSGFTEYLTKDNSLLIEPLEYEEAFDGVWFHGGFDWVSWTHKTNEQFVEHIKTLYNKGKGQINEAGISTAKEYSWTNSATKLLNALS